MLVILLSLNQTAWLLAVDKPVLVSHLFKA